MVASTSHHHHLIHLLLTPPDHLLSSPMSYFAPKRELDEEMQAGRVEEGPHPASLLVYYLTRSLLTGTHN